MQKVFLLLLVSGILSQCAYKKGVQPTVNAHNYVQGTTTTPLQNFCNRLVATPSVAADRFYQVTGENILFYAWYRDQDALSPIYKELAKASSLTDDNRYLGRTPLHWACNLLDSHVVKKCLAAGASINQQDTPHGDTPLHLVVMHYIALAQKEVLTAAEEMDKAIATQLIQVLIQAGAQLHIANIQGETPNSLASQAIDTHLTALLQGQSMKQKQQPHRVVDRSSLSTTSSASSLIPKGTIWLYNGDPKDLLATDWALCDGTNGTPDMRGRFVVGAAIDSEDMSLKCDTHSLYPYPLLNSRDVTQYQQLTIDQLPSHSHEAVIKGQGKHTHVFELPPASISKKVNKKNNGDGTIDMLYNDYLYIDCLSVSIPIALSGNHTHTCSIHHIGNGKPLNMAPPTHALYYIMKIR